VYRLAGEFATRPRHSVYLDVYTPPLLYLQMFVFVEGFAYLYLRRADVILIGLGMGTVCLVSIVRAVMYRFGYWRESYKALNALQG
jgi:hypothetical protein